MSVVADFSVPAEAFCLARTLEAVPEMSVELDRSVAHSPDYVIPFLWVLGDDWNRFERALAEDPTVVDATPTDSFPDARLYQFEWTELVDERLQTVLDPDGVILEAHGSAAEWRLWVRFGSRQHFSQFKDHFEDEGPVTLLDLLHLLHRVNAEEEEVDGRSRGVFGWWCGRLARRPVRRTVPGRGGEVGSERAVRTQVDRDSVGVRPMDAPSMESRAESCTSACCSPTMSGTLPTSISMLWRRCCRRTSASSRRPLPETEPVRGGDFRAPGSSAPARI